MTDQSRGELLQLLAEAYEDSADPVMIPIDEHAAIEARVGPHAAAYGEPTAASLSRIWSALPLGPTDSLLDIGSGTGRVLLHAALQTQAHSLIGIEISPSRVRIAEAALTRLMAHAPKPFPSDRIRFECRDFRSATLPAVTHVWAGISAFPEPVRRELWRQLSAQARPLTILSTEPPEPESKAAFRLRAKIPIATTWIPRLRLWLLELR